MQTVNRAGVVFEEVPSPSNVGPRAAIFCQSLTDSLVGAEIGLEALRIGQGAENKDSVNQMVWDNRLCLLSPICLAVAVDQQNRQG